MSFNPGVVHKDKNGNERLIDIGTRLLMDRIIMCTGEITDELAESIVAQLLYLEAEDPDKPIQMMVAGPGGIVTAGNQIIAAMNTVKCPVYTTVIGQVASMSTVIAASGEKGKRKIYPLSRIMIHQVSGGQSGNVQDVRVNYKEMERINDMTMEHLAKFCGKKVTQLKKDCERDLWLGAKEAIDYGVVDELIEKHK